jgi:hypothetical protein
VTTPRTSTDFAHFLPDLVDVHFPDADTPKHASWLNIVEIELSVLVKQCLKRRIPDLATLQREVSTWEKQRNAQRATIKWCFNLTHVRTGLARFYP